MPLSTKSIWSSWGQRGDPEATGRPSYHPSVLLKLYIYGYLNRVQSNRRLEREAGRNIEVLWLAGRLVPDHKTRAFRLATVFFGLP
jgi:transposase